MGAGRVAGAAHLVVGCFRCALQCARQARQYLPIHTRTCMCMSQAAVEPICAHARDVLGTCSGHAWALPDTMIPPSGLRPGPRSAVRKQRRRCALGVCTGGGRQPLSWQLRGSYDDMPIMRAAGLWLRAFEQTEGARAGAGCSPSPTPQQAPAAARRPEGPRRGWRRRRAAARRRAA